MAWHVHSFISGGMHNPQRTVVIVKARMTGPQVTACQNYRFHRGDPVSTHMSLVCSHSGTLHRRSIHTNGPRAWKVSHFSRIAMRLGELRATL